MFIIINLFLCHKIKFYLIICKNTGDDGATKKYGNVAKNVLYVIGLLIGMVIGDMLDNIVIGIVLGLVLGVGFAETNNYPAAEGERHEQSLNKFLLAIATLIFVIVYYLIR